MIMIVVMAGCGGKSNSSKPVITVSYGSQQWLAEQIAGDGFEVVALLPPGTDPETFDPGIATLADIQRGGAYLTTSTLGFESEMVRKVKSNFEDVRIFDLSENVAMIHGTHLHAGCSHKGHDQDDSDPHLLSSVKNAKIISTNILKALTALYPDSAEGFLKRHSILEQRLDSLDRSIEQSAGLHPGAFVVVHPSLTYFARDYGWLQIPLESGGKEASPKQYRERIDNALSSRPAVMFVEQGHNQAQALQTAQMLGLPAHTMKINDRTWFEDIKQIASALQNSKTPAERN